MQDQRQTIAAAIERVFASEDAPAAAAPPVDAGAGLIPNPCALRLGWLAASVIVSERYADSALDAIPIHHPDHGWDRFLLTRRVSCNLLTDEASNAFGMIDVASPDAPRLTDPDGNLVLPLGELFKANVAAALEQLAAHFPPLGIVAGDHSACAHTRAERYPALYRVVAQLVADYPDVVAGRELVVDDQLIDNAYHPLYLHTAKQALGPTFDWFALQSLNTGYVAFARINGRQSIYRTDRATWASSPHLLSKLPEEEIAILLRSWLRLAPRPDGHLTG